MAVYISTELADLRRSILKKLILRDFSNINDFCKQKGEDYSLIHRYLSGKIKIGNVAKKKFEQIFGISEGEFDKYEIIDEQVFLINAYYSSGAFTSLENLLSRDPVDIFPVSKKIITELNIAKDNLILIILDNDSLEPKLNKGWVILIDIENKEIVDGAIYALLINNSLFVRKVYKSANEQYWIKPINESFETFKLSIEQFSVIGRAVHIISGGL